ncbi:MAG: FixH family protein [Alphaproteobacteria bacterium]|nr:FixH family protein [Alphaproteobacteria bacterium]|tara:strand:+ start:28747 stop:29259 length:513 start_codon:yes stop_codon:yes gene_type:complete
MSVQDMTANEPSSGKRLKGRHVLMYFMGFFGLMFVVNGIFLEKAITSFPGEDVEKSYLQGLNYNSTLAARQAQSELGWQAQAGLEDGIVRFHLEDAKGNKLSAMHVSAVLKHAANATLDTPLVMAAIGDGDYTATLPVGLPAGKWTLQTSVQSDAEEDVLFTASKTLLIR